MGMRQGDHERMRRIDEIYMKHSWMGSRSIAGQLTTPEAAVGRDRVRLLMRIMGIESLCLKPGTRQRQPRHPVYPHLLCGMDHRPSQPGVVGRNNRHPHGARATCTGSRSWIGPAATCFPGGFPAPPTHFCVEALKEALFKYGAPKISSSDQGFPFTSGAFTSVLKAWNVRIGMVGRGRFKDSTFIERLVSIRYAFRGIRMLKKENGLPDFRPSAERRQARS